ncbi:NADAR family protein [Saccharothrix yanglingensis]|uniref:NADAR family protein n=1 Tax=Saccharothrix yanglingensis TaxID=659496 RepID=UPI0027D27E14|nr:NADAR family protein [Saccharothrix yanglingensis]
MEEYLFFWGHRTRPGAPVGKQCLSQWFEAPFTEDGRTYPTAEHHMMVGKALLFGDGDTAGRVLRARTPGEAKALGRQVRGFDEDTWVAHRVDLVVRANLGKFGAHDDLRAFLLGTGDRVLVEASPVDRVWGIGLAEDDERAADPAAWRGLNLLGQALMTVRERLRAA